MLVEQLGVAGAGPERRQAQHAACGRRARGSRQRGHGQRVREDGVRRVGEVVEVLDVRAQQVGRAGEVLRRRPDPARVSSSGQHVAADPGPGEARVLVGRVGPPADVLGAAGLLGLGAGEVEQRAGGRPRTSGACRPASGRRCPGSAPAGRSRPGRRGCARAARSRSRTGRRAPRGRRTSPGGRPPRGPCPSPSTLTRIEAVSSAPSAAICPTTWVATSADASCRPWSTVTPTTGHGCSRASKTAAASRASESAPPEQATRTGAEPGSPTASARRTATRVAATAGSGPHGQGPASPRRLDRRSRPWWAGGRGPARRR